jgi:hypothetical protein
MISFARLAALLALCALAGCNLWQYQPEFAPPQSRWPGTLWSRNPYPSPATADPAPTPVSHCYRTLAQVECFTEPQPDRVTGYTGTYPAD